MNCPPRTLLIPCAVIRVITSPGPPAAYGIIIVTGLLPGVLCQCRGGEKTSCSDDSIENFKHKLLQFLPMSAVPSIATELCTPAKRRCVPMATDAPQQTASLFDHLVALVRSD